MYVLLVIPLFAYNLLFVIFVFHQKRELTITEAFEDLVHRTHSTADIPTHSNETSNHSHALLSPSLLVRRTRPVRRRASGTWSPLCSDQSFSFDKSTAVTPHATRDTNFCKTSNYSYCWAGLIMAMLMTWLLSLATLWLVLRGSPAVQGLT
jgi:hypothetical protein